MAAPIKSKIFERSGIIVLARVINPNTKAYISQASLTSVKYEVWDTATRTKVTAEQTLTIANVVFDTLQTSGWSTDSTGYNFAVVLAGSNFPSNSTYQVEFKFTPASGETWIVPYVLTAQKMYYGD